MKQTKIILGATLLFLFYVTVGTCMNSLYKDPCADPSRDVILDSIRWVESKCDLHNIELYPHYYDKHSWGQYGITQIAVNELIRVGMLMAGTKVEDVAGHSVSEARQREVAGMYLDVCMKHAKTAWPLVAPTWYIAALVYHAGCAEEREKERARYGQRIRNAIERRNGK